MTVTKRPSKTAARYTPEQIARRVALMESGLPRGQADVAEQISKRDGMACSRQAVEAAMMDRYQYGPPVRIVEGFCRAVRKHGEKAADVMRRLWPVEQYPKLYGLEDAAPATSEATGGADDAAGSE